MISSARLGSVVQRSSGQAINCYAEQRRTKMMNSQVSGEPVVRGAALALIALALGGIGVAFVAGVLGRIDSQVVAVVALVGATFACCATVAYFLYIVVSDRRELK